MDGGGGVDTEQKGSFFGLGVFLHFFSSSRDDGLYHVTRNNTNVCDIFPFFFETTDLSSSFWGEKTHTTTRRRRTKQNNQ